MRLDEQRRCEVKRKYAALRGIALVFRVLAWIVLIVGFVGFVGGLIARGIFLRLGPGFPVEAAGIHVVFLQLFSVLASFLLKSVPV